jgi:Flp pilus assembly pilin Flp
MMAERMRRRRRGAVALLGQRRRRDDRGAVLVEFALVSVVFAAMVFGGIFVLSGVIAKGETISGVSSAVQLAASGVLDAPTLQSCEASPPIASDGQPASGDTLTTLCEIEDIISAGSVFDTDTGSLQVALYCENSRSQPTGCGPGRLDPTTGVWVCARAYDPNSYPGITSAGWITAQALADVASTVTLKFSPFSPASSPFDNHASTLACPGPS